MGFDFVLGAFAAGLVVGLVLDTPDGEVVRMRLEGIGFGFLIPIYFVTTGLDFDIDSLLTASGSRSQALFLALLFVIRGSASLLWRRELGPRRTLSLAFFVATGLPLIVAIVGHRDRPGRDRHRCRRVAHRGRDDLRPRVPVRRDAPLRQTRARRAAHPSSGEPAVSEY